MDKGRIASLRLLEKHLRASGQMAGAVIGELLDALEAAQAHITRLEADGARIGAEELAVLREIARLLDEARQRYDKHPRGAGGQRMPDEIDGLLCRLYEMGAHPASRVLREGFAAVSEEELVALRCLDDAVTINGDEMSTEALGVDWEVARSAKRRLSDIRAAKGGAT